jgi:hypothetical protein
MIRTGLFSILLLSRLVCAAQDGATPTYSVHGTVVNAQTNQPTARAEVILNQDYAVLTGSEGRFAFDQIPAGEYQVSVGRPGYISIGNFMGGNFGRGIRHPLQPQQIRVGPNMPELTFRLAPSASIRGQLSLSSSDSADGIRITVLQRQVWNGRPRWEPAGFAATDSDGIFHVGDLAPGRYMLFTEGSLDRPGLAAGRDAATWGYPPVYYPGVTDAASAGVLTLGAGQTAEADFTLTRQAFYTLIAQVRGGDSGIRAGFQILDAGGRFTNMPARYDPREEVVRASVPNGSWILQGQRFGPGPSRQEHAVGRTAFQVANGPVHIAIAVVPIPLLQMTIRREFTAKAEAQSQPAIMGIRGVGGPQVNFQLDNAEPFAQGGMISAPQFDPNADPSAETTTGTVDAMPGRYWVEANSWNETYVSSVSSGGVDLATNPLTISPDSSNAPIEVVLRNDVGTINVQINGQASGESGADAGSSVGEVPHIYIYAIPLYATASSNIQPNLGANGQFQIPNLPPGSYRVVACDSDQELEFHTAEGLAAWAGKGQVVTVEPGGTASVQVDVLHMEPQP